MDRSRPMLRSRVFRWGIVAAWAAYCIMQYRIAANRIEECMDTVTGGQQDICIRHALEQRDNVPLWGIGLPLGVMIVIAFVDHIRQQP